MEQIRARIESRRSVDSAPAADEERERAAGVLPPSESFAFDGHSIYHSSRGGVGRVLYGVRRLLRPLLKFVLNIDPMVDALATQARLNAQQAAFDAEVARRAAAREERDAESRRVVEKLMAEMEQLSTEMKSQRMLVESMAERLDALEPARADTHAASPHGGGPAEKPAGDAAPSSSPPAEEPSPPNR